MRPGLAWWLKPFLGSIIAILGLFLFVLLVATQLQVKGCDFKVDRPILPFPAELHPDIEVAPGAPGHVASLGMAGRQLHFEDKGRGKTWIAIEAWFGGEPWRIAVAEYDGRPTLTPAAVRPLEPFLPMLVVRTGDEEPVWWAGDVPDGPQGPSRPEAGELNLLVLPGKLSLWAGDGPRYEVEVKGSETVRCTLGPEGLAIDRSERR